MQQHRDNLSIIELIARFQHDESQATRQLLQIILRNPQKRLNCLKAFNKLLSIRGNQSGRRDVAAIARLIADSNIFEILEKQVAKENEQQNLGKNDITIEVTKLISNICSQNPHFIDNIVSNRLSILQLLFSLYSKEKTTPSDPESISTILNFLHNISLKQTQIRKNKIGPCLQQFLQNILSQTKFCNFISNTKRYQYFLVSLTKFYSNVEMIYPFIFNAVDLAMKYIGDEYKRLGDIYKDDRYQLTQKRIKILQLCEYNDKKLIGVLRLFQKSRSTILSRVEIFNYAYKLTIFIKIAIKWPISLINKPLQNKLLISLVCELLTTIKQFIANKIKQYLQSNNKLQLKQQQSCMVIFNYFKDKHQIQYQDFQKDYYNIINIIQISKNIQVFTSTIKYCVNFIYQSILQLNNKHLNHQYKENIKFIITFQTARIERILSWMTKLFTYNQLKKQTYFQNILQELLKILPFYFENAILTQNQIIKSEIDKMSDITNESDHNIMRFQSQNIDEQIVKANITKLLIQKTNIYMSIHQVIIKFAYSIIQDGQMLKYVMNNFIHRYMKQIKQKYLPLIKQKQQLDLKDIQILKLLYRIYSQFIKIQINNESINQILIQRIKLYRYCREIIQSKQQNNIFQLFINIFNILQKYNIDLKNNQQLIDNIKNRQIIIKNNFVKYIFIKIRSNIHIFIQINQQLSFHDSEQQNKILQSTGQSFQLYYQGYYSYLKCMSSFFMKTASGIHHQYIKNDITQLILQKIFNFNPLRGHKQQQYKIIQIKLQQIINKILNNWIQWLFKSINLYIHQIPFFIRKIICFKKQNQYGLFLQQQMKNQNQIKLIQNIIYNISQKLTQSSLILINKKLDLKIKIKKIFKINLQNILIQQQIICISNIIKILTQILQLLINLEYYTYQHPQISSNYIYSILDLIQNIFILYKIEIQLPYQTNQLIINSLWLIDTYINYQEILKEYRKISHQQKLKDKKIIKKIRKQKIKQLKFKKNNQNKSQINKNNKNKKRRNRKKIKIQQQKQLSKNNYKNNIYINQSKQNKNNLFNKIKSYIKFLLENLSKNIPFINDDTYAYLLNFINKYMYKNNIPPTSSKKTFNIKLSQILSYLLNIKIKDHKIYSYYLILCKIILQTFDDHHITIDLELKIKRYIYQRQEQTIDLHSFVQMLKNDFKGYTHIVSSLVDIAHTQGQGEEAKIIRQPFSRSKYEQSKLDGITKYEIILKQGVQFHYINSKIQQSNRKQSNQYQQIKPIKVIEYNPQGQLYYCIQQLIIQSIRLIIIQLDNSITNQSYQNQLQYSIHLQPINIRSIIYILHYLIRQSPSLAPFITRFKCKKIIINLLNSNNIKNKNKLTSLILNLISLSNDITIDNLPQIRYLSVLLRLFSPLTTNAINELIFELCLDSTPLVQVNEYKTQSLDLKDNKIKYLSFAYIIRRKILQQIQNIIFSSIQLQWLYRKLSLINIISVLMIIRQMAKLLNQNNFINKLYKSFKSIKNILKNNCQSYNGNYINKLITPFYLNTIAVMQQINICFHCYKKMNKDSQKINISSPLNSQSINSQLINPDILKNYKFKQDWPFSNKKELNILDNIDQNDSNSEPHHQQYSSMSQESYQSYQSDLQFQEDPQAEPDDDSMHSSLSILSSDARDNYQFNQQWDYSQSNPYPEQADPIIQSEEDESQGDHLDGANDQQDDQQQHQIQQYMQNEVDGEASSIINMLNESEMNYHPIFPFQHQFIVKNLNEDSYYEMISDILNFKGIDSPIKLSKLQKKQTNLLRLYLQCIIYNKRKIYINKTNKILSSTQIKQNKIVQDNYNLIQAFSKDIIIKYSQFVQYNQIYRYDRHNQELPRPTSEIQELFKDYFGNHHIMHHNVHKRRNAIIHPENFPGLLPNGWNITEVYNHPIQPGHEENDDEEQQNENNSQSHIVINSEQEDDMNNQQEPPFDQQINSQQHAENIETILRNSNLRMSVREFMRLDPEIQQDILMNIHEMHQQNRQSPPPSLAEEIPRLNLPENQFNQQNSIQENERHSLSQEYQQIINESEVENEMIAEQQNIDNNEIQQNEIILNDGQIDNNINEVYRKMSLQHSKKITKDIIQLINKEGKNNNKFYELQQNQIQQLLSILYQITQIQYIRYPYQLIQTSCINLNNLSKIISNFIVLLHLIPSKYKYNPYHPIIYTKSLNQIQFNQLYQQTIYPQILIKILHILSHLTQVYSISMPFLRINYDITNSLIQWKHQLQQKLSSFQMLILLLQINIVNQSPMILNFLIKLLDNITMHHFYKNVNKIVQNKILQPNQTSLIDMIKINQNSIQLLGQLLQSDFVGDSIPLVSKIIMRLSIQKDNLNNFINYLQKLIKQLTDIGLQQILNLQQDPKQDSNGRLKLANLMAIFYEMVKAFETYPTSNERHIEVLASLKQIVQYQKIQNLCQTALKFLCQSSNKNVYIKIGDAVQCFFILYQIAIITSNKIDSNPKQQNDQHNHIAQLGQIGYASLRKSQIQDSQDIYLGKFNLTKLWKQGVTHPNFKIYINDNIKNKLKKLTSRKMSAYDSPIIKVASSIPHLLSFDNKYALFKSELKKLRGKDNHQHIHINIRRQDIFQDSYQQLMSSNGDKFKYKFKIQFDGQEGQDAGGVTRQWFQLLSREMFNPNYCLFRSGSGGHTYHPNSQSYVNQRHLDYFKFIGRIMGKALYDNYFLDAFFTPAFYKHILALPITYSDMQQQDYEYFKSLTWILQNSPIEDFLQLSFTYDCEHFGQIQTKQLIPNGSNIAVTQQNKIQYVQLIAYAKMATSIKLQLQAFLTGLHQLIPHKLLKIFTEKQLQIMISGRPTVDIEDLRRNTDLVNYMKNDSIIIWLFEVLQSFDMEMRTGFIQFVTGSSRVPVQGFKDLRGMNGVQRFNIHRQFQEDRLPRAHTCFNQLDLPNYKSKQILIEKLTYAIKQGRQGFGMI